MKLRFIYDYKLPFWVKNGRKTHQAIIEENTGIVACGETWCEGKCGLPKLVYMTTNPDREGGQKTYMIRSALGAICPVFMELYKHWEGPIVHITSDMSEDELFKQMWW